MKLFEANSRDELEAVVNTFLATLPIAKVADVTLQTDGNGSMMHTRYFAWIIYQV